MSNPAIPPDILGLPIPDRIALVEQIWDTIAKDESQFQLTDAQKAELDRRLEERDKAASRGAEWDEVKKRITGES